MLYNFGEAILLWVSGWVVVYGILQVLPSPFGFGLICMMLAFIAGVIYEKEQNGETII